MAKTNITLYSSTPSSNTDINNINIDENCPASGLNNAIRELMAHLKNVDTGSQALTALSVTGNLLVGGTTTNHQAGSSQEQLSYIAGGYFAVSRSSNDVAFFNRQSTDGSIINVRKDGTTVGTIGSISGTYLYMDSPSASFFKINGTNEVAIASAKMYSPTDARTDLGSSSERFKNLYLSGGAYLGGTGSANHLDDYEEGTFTPTVASTGTNPTVTYSKQEGNYTKIGNQVTVTGLIEFSAFTSNGGSLRLEGLPFNVATHTDYRAVGSVMVDSVATNLTGDYTNIQLAYNSGTSCQIFMNNSVTGGVAETPANNIDAGTKFRYQLSYITLA